MIPRWDEDALRQNTGSREAGKDVDWDRQQCPAPWFQPCVKGFPPCDVRLCQRKRPGRGNRNSADRDRRKRAARHAHKKAFGQRPSVRSTRPARAETSRGRLSACCGPATSACLPYCREIFLRPVTYRCLQLSQVAFKKVSAAFNQNKRFRLGGHGNQALENFLWTILVARAADEKLGLAAVLEKFV